MRGHASAAGMHMNGQPITPHGRQQSSPTAHAPMPCSASRGVSAHATEGASLAASLAPASETEAVGSTRPPHATRRAKSAAKLPLRRAASDDTHMRLAPVFMLLISCNQIIGNEPFTYAPPEDASVRAVGAKAYADAAAEASDAKADAPDDASDARVEAGPCGECEANEACCPSGGTAHSPLTCLETVNGACPMFP